MLSWKKGKGPGPLKSMVSHDVPRELWAQHFTRAPRTAWLTFRVLLDIHRPNTFPLALLVQIPSVISSVQLGAVREHFLQVHAGEGYPSAEQDAWTPDALAST